ncbi:uncharacterized protein LOC142555545 [Primulina tabacum]|uniref:uncharacterized protein LOC142555545 n=1 Tax=Primulina tabacum TaxID=48773 RepID=UPI003F5AA385
MESHQAVDGLLFLFSKANRDLSMVHHKLREEFHQLYPDNANPMNLVGRLKKIEGEMSSLKNQCRELLAAKQDLIDKARTVLVGNKALLQRLQVSAGVPMACDDDDLSYENFNQIIDEWTVQVRAKTEGVEEPGSNNINQLLFSAIVRDN